MPKLVWLGNNASKTLANPVTGQVARVGDAITLSDQQVAALRARGHRFAEPKSPEAEAALEAEAAKPAPRPARNEG